MTSARKKKVIYTYEDYLKWDDSVRCELIDGIVYDMTPAPSTEHQKILGTIFNLIWNFLKNKKCEIFPAPFDVRLLNIGKSSDSINSVVQPDLSVICDPKKIDEKGCLGAPDLIIEIISPSTAAKDRKEKFFLYEKHGVKEYWIVQPDEKIITLFELENSSYGKQKIFTIDDTIKSKTLKGLKIKLSNIFL